MHKSNRGWLIPIRPPHASCHCASVRYTLHCKVGDPIGVQTEEMRDLDKALADIIAIRSQLAAGTAFAGYGPAAIAATAAVAFATTVLQYAWLADPTHHPLAFLF